MSGTALDFTPQQKTAISARGSALLVSAGAGSGKTKVLVERLLGYLSNPEDPCDITEFLIITYTRAAANELKARILDELSERLTYDPGNRHLRRQTSLCFEAPISTIHSFCTEIIRENAHLLSISPDFRVADESESGLIKDKVLEELLEERYETIHETPGFSLLVDTMSAGRDDRRLKEIVLDAHIKLQSHEEPLKWIQEQLKLLELDGVTDASETEWGRFLMADARKKAVYWYDVMLCLLEDMSVHLDFSKAYGESITATAESLRRFARALEKSWDEARACAVIDFPRPKSVKGYEELKEIRKKCRDAVKKTASVFECASKDLLEDMAAVYPAVAELLKLVSDFDKAYSLAKKMRGIIDFSDQEHMTAHLLTDRETGAPSELALSVSKRYREIMVDEYQDCSRVQERIFSAISKDGKNIFMVGDVKQSIYRFRLADPSIFLRKYKSFADEPDAEGANGRRVLLSTNFRSGAGILSAVNFVYKNIMSEEFGEMAYTEREFLYPGRADASGDAPAVELDVLDMRRPEPEDEEENTENTEKAEIEADFVAGRIEALVDSGMKIPDGQGGTRPVSYGDIAILLRSVRDKAGVYAQALIKRCIPAGLPGGESFFETLEVSVTLSLLGIIDNPMQDVPLIAVLRSPVYGFTPDELAMIRLADKKTDFYSALLKTAETNVKCAHFLEELNSFREQAPELPSDRLLWHVYNKTGLLGIMGALKGGELRRLNLMKLLELAGRYEANGYKGLFGFMTMIRHLMDSGGEPDENNDTTSGDAVKIMSIHKSKGLEFPVVILADTTKRFNNKDVTKPLLIHAQLGVGAKRTDLTRRIEYTTLARMAVSKKLTQEMMAEELRVLYVAMTRAREKLIIVSTFSDAGKELAKLQKDTKAPVPPQVMEGIMSHAGFILTAALLKPEAECLREGPADLTADDGRRWDIRRISACNSGLSGQMRIETEPVHVKARIEDVEALREKLQFDYPYAKAAEIPSKLTATELKGRFADFEAAQEADIPEFSKKQSAPLPRPNFITLKTDLTASERGTALHLAMQYIDYNKCQSIEAVKEELSRLKNKYFISGRQYESVDASKILTFFQSAVGQRVLRSEKLYREFKFSLLVKANEYYDGGGDDEILFQGVIDCCFVEEGALHIIDFKTDYVTPETIEEKKRLYKGQLAAYGRAMERLTGLPVGSRILYFFMTGTAAEI